MFQIVIETEKGDCVIHCDGWASSDIEHYLWSIGKQGYTTRLEWVEKPRKEVR